MISNDLLVSYKLTVDGIGELTGVNTLVNSAMTFNSTWVGVNNGTLRLLNHSAFVEQGTLNGTGAITANNSSVTIAGPSQTSETISLVNHSNLYLGVAPGVEFMAPITIDATSEIHVDNNPLGWISGLLGHNPVPQPADLIGGIAVVHSSTPGYAPQPEILSSGGHETGLIIVDKPIIATHS